MALSPSLPDTRLRDGVLNVRKEAGWTSHDVVARLRGKLRGGKVGHAGTLDPAATGVLPVLVGKATRIAEYLLTWDKQYLVELRLGETTDTQDATGTVLDRNSVDHLTEQAVRDAAARFEGRILQVPPMYSAVKVRGVPLYKSARAGREIEREARAVTIERLEVLRVCLPDVTLRVVCSKGTYMRTLCADIGESLGVGGHMLALDRERVGPLKVEEALTVAEVESRLAEGTFGAVLLTLDGALQGLPACTVGPESAARILHGTPVEQRDVLAWVPAPVATGDGADHAIRLKDEQGRLLGIGMLRGDVSDGRQPLISVSKVLVTE
ncbi:MAG: tRNA pseudouridine(55) synthase TruB [Nitrospiraceae bacterium]|nr:tRNA pseudouridine(55) synthase TruB [Nitrospiraceae bacterium]